MSGVDLFSLVFYLLAVVTVASAAGVALSNNIVYSAFALMGTLLGAAGLFVMLAADFVAVIQVLIYVGGILVLMLFAVMLTHRVADVRISNRALGRWPTLFVIAVIGGLMGDTLRITNWHQIDPTAPAPTTYAIGDGFLTTYVLPFELASIVLLAALIGAVVLSRKELKDERA